MPDSERSPSGFDRTSLCIVVPAYNEEGNLPTLVQEVDEALANLDIAYTYLVVDDGSTDATPAILHRLASTNPRVGYVRLARNFGLQGALAAGFELARGDCVVVMDADLQDDPGAIPRMLQEWRRGAQVVYAVRTSRRESRVRTFLAKAFYWLVNLLAETSIPRDAGSFALCDRKVVDHINSLPESNRYLPGLRAWVGFRQVAIEVPRRERRSGKPVQSLRRLISLALDGIFSFSKAPLRASTILGFLVTGASGLALLVIVYWRFVQQSFPAGVGQATIALSLLFLGGVQLLMLGMIGEYVGRVYDEVKRRPHFIVAEQRLPSVPPALDASRASTTSPVLR